MDVTSIKDSTCRKIVYDKVQGVDYDKIGSSVAIFEVYTDYSSNHCIWDMTAGEQNCIPSQEDKPRMYTRYNQRVLSIHRMLDRYANSYGRSKHHGVGIFTEWNSQMSLISSGTTKMLAFARN